MKVFSNKWAWFVISTKAWIRQDCFSAAACGVFPVALGIGFGMTAGFAVVAALNDIPGNAGLGHFRPSSRN